MQSGHLVNQHNLLCGEIIKICLFSSLDRNACFSILSLKFENWLSFLDVFQGGFDKFHLSLKAQWWLPFHDVSSHKWRVLMKDQLKDVSNSPLNFDSWLCDIITRFIFQSTSCLRYPVIFSRIFSSSLVTILVTIFCRDRFFNGFPSTS